MRKRQVMIPLGMDQKGKVMNPKEPKKPALSRRMKFMRVMIYLAAALLSAFSGFAMQQLFLSFFGDALLASSAVYFLCCVVFFWLAGWLWGKLSGRTRDSSFIDRLLSLYPW